MRSLLYCIFFLGLVSLTQAQNKLDQSSTEALQKTLELLNNPALRESSLNTKEAKQADENAKQVSGSKENTDKMYSVSGEIFQHLTEKTSGNPEELMKMMDQAKKDPKAFYESLPKDLQNKISEFSKELPKSHGSQSTAH